MPDPVAPSRGAAIQPIVAGALATTVGFASTFALILQALAAAGATPAEAASGLFALLLATGAIAIGLSWWTRMPVSIAWSTPGAALLLATGAPAGGFPAATGAFLLSAGLIVLAGLVRPFGRAVAAIPAGIASAMLAGILLDLCLAPVRAVATVPALALPVVLAWAVTFRLARLYAIPVAVVVAGVVIAATTMIPAGGGMLALPRPIPVAPVFTLDAAIGLALPLFIVTMASQNVPGLAVMHANGYRPAIGPIFVVTGLGSSAVSVLGGHAVNLAAITAALCAGPEAGPDPSRRWIAAVVAGVGYLGYGLLAGTAAAFVAASPPLLIQAVAGLALLGSLGGALQTALAHDEERVPALVAFVTTASGIAVAGVGAPFWGLVAGCLMLAILRTGSKAA